MRLLLRSLPLLCSLIALSACLQEQPPGPPEQPTTKPSTSETPVAVSPVSIGESVNIGMLSIKPQDAGPAVDLGVQSLRVNVEVVGRMARTTVTQVFKNHTSRRTAGEYRFTLPQDAALSRLAMSVGEKMMEGELVEREKARMIYESIVRKRKDPALLEWKGGNRFSTRVFPIEPNSTKTVSISYDTLLPEQGDMSRYTFSLPVYEGTSKGGYVGDFDFSLKGRGVDVLKASGYAAEVQKTKDGEDVSYSAQNFNPKGALTVDLRTQTQGTVRTKGAGGLDARVSPMIHRHKDHAYMMIDVVPNMPAYASQSAPHRVLALDTSAGLGQPVVTRAAKLAQKLIEQSPQGTTFDVVLGDYKVDSGPAQALTKEAAIARLQDVQAGGATNLEALIKAATDRAKTREGDVTIVLMSDGAASMGQLDGALIKSDAQKALLPQHTLHTLAIGHAPDEDMLRQLARAGRGQSVRVTPNAPIDLIAAPLQNTLNQPLLVGVKATVVEGEVQGLEPAQPRNLVRGEAMAVLGRILSDKAVVELQGTYMGKPWSQRVEVGPAHAATNELLPKFWARQRIDTLQAQDAPRAEVVGLSQSMGVMSKYTSFLVLESEQAYEKYKIERKQEKARKAAEIAAKLAQANKEMAKSEDKASSAAPAAAAPADNIMEEAEREEQGEGKADAPQAQANLEKSSGSLQDLLQRSKGGRASDGAAPSALREAPAPEPSMDVAAKTSPERPQRAPRPALRREMAPGSGGLGAGGAGRGGGGQGFGGVGGLGNSGADGFIAENRVLRRKKLRRKKKVRADRKYDRHAPTRPAKNVYVLPSPRVKQLEQKLKEGTLVRTERATLLDHYVATSPSKARATFKKLSALAKLKESPQNALDLIASDASKKMFAKEYVAGIVAAHADRRIGWNSLSDLARYAPLDKAFVEMMRPGKTPESTANALEMVDALNDTYSSEEVAQRYILPISEGDLALRLKMLKLLKPTPSVDRQLITTYQAMDPSKLDAQSVKDYAHMTLEQKIPQQSIELVTNACKKELLSGTECGALLEAYSASKLDKSSLSPMIKQMEAFYASQMDALVKARREDISNTTLILQQADLFKKMGRPEASHRVLSEMAEFAPHDYAVRMRYASEVNRRVGSVEACEQYAMAIQLDPAKRDTFQTMMKLRTDANAKDIRECIVQGVSNLPVKRAVSLVLTWDTPRNDVDLHIHEQGNQHVSYQNRESKNGGLLYYDITSGYGPEIYVLGSGPEGRYDLSLVYYRGSQRNVSGTLTVLRDAGSPEESRQDIPFVLPYANRTREISVGSFTLTASDRSADKSEFKQP